MKECTGCKWENWLPDSQLEPWCPCDICEQYDQWESDDNKWHDLRKNPSDLPKEKGYYEVRFLHKKGTVDVELNAFWNKKKWTNFSNTVIAWRKRGQYE